MCLPSRGDTSAGSLLSLRVQVAAGLDGIETVNVLRMQGATWAAIGEAVGMSRQSAHERWSARVTGVLDPIGEEHVDFGDRQRWCSPLPETQSVICCSSSSS